MLIFSSLFYSKLLPPPSQVYVDWVSVSKHTIGSSGSPVAVRVVFVWFAKLSVLNYEPQLNGVEFIDAEDICGGNNAN